MKLLQYINSAILCGLYVNVLPNLLNCTSHVYMQTSEGVFDQVEWDEWINAPGMPPFKPQLVKGRLSWSKNFLGFLH